MAKNNGGICCNIYEAIEVGIQHEVCLVDPIANHNPGINACNFPVGLKDSLVAVLHIPCCSGSGRC